MAEHQAHDYAPDEILAIREILDRVPKLETDARSIGADRLARLLADAHQAAIAHAKAAGLNNSR